MNKSKRIIRSFINHLFGVYNAPRIPVHVIYGYDVLETPSGIGFGFYNYSEDSEKKAIYVAAGMGTSVAMHSIAHEFCHYLQHIHGRDMSDDRVEKDAEYWADGLCGKWYINKKMRNKHCYGIAPIWEEGPRNERENQEEAQAQGIS